MRVKYGYAMIHLAHRWAEANGLGMGIGAVLDNIPLVLEAFGVAPVFEADTATDYPPDLITEFTT